MAIKPFQEGSIRRSLAEGDYATYQKTLVPERINSITATALLDDGETLAILHYEGNLDRILELYNTTNNEFIKKYNGGSDFNVYRADTKKRLEIGSDGYYFAYNGKIYRVNFDLTSHEVVVDNFQQKDEEQLLNFWMILDFAVDKARGEIYASVLYHTSVGNRPGDHWSFSRYRISDGVDMGSMVCACASCNAVACYPHRVELKNSGRVWIHYDTTKFNRYSEDLNSFDVTTEVPFFRSIYYFDIDEINEEIWTVYNGWEMDIYGYDGAKHGRIKAGGHVPTIGTEIRVYPEHLKIITVASWSYVRFWTRAEWDSSPSPSALLSLLPTESPSNSPSLNLSNGPSLYPSNGPSSLPSSNPSNGPSLNPSNRPSSLPTLNPSDSLSSIPTLYPSSPPSIQSAQLLSWNINRGNTSITVQSPDQIFPTIIIPYNISNREFGATIYDIDCVSTLENEIVLHEQNVLSSADGFVSTEVHLIVNTTSIFGNFTNAGTTEYSFCVRESLFLNTTHNIITEVNFLDTVMKVEFDMTGELNAVVTAVERTAAEEEAKSIDFSSYIEVFHCNEDKSVVTNSAAPLTQGSLLNICIKSDTVKAVEIESVKDLSISSSSGAYSMTALHHNVIIDSSIVVNGNCEVGVCIVTMQLMAMFFIEEEDTITVSGSVNLNFVYAANDRFLSEKKDISLPFAKGYNARNTGEEIADFELRLPVQKEMVDQASAARYKNDIIPLLGFLISFYQLQ